MLNAKKSLGQNFLVDLNVIKKIINLVDIEKRNILEIGPGNGALTNEILKKKPKSLILIEKDNFLAERLDAKFHKLKNVKIYNSDILNFELEKNLKPKSIIFGNLPYNISSQILVKILKLKKWPPSFSDLIFMFQKELSETIIGKYKSKDYGRISILTNYRLNFCQKFLVSKNCFKPKPKITSCVLHLTPKTKNQVDIKKISNLEKVTNILFSNKRKMIKKNLLKIISNDQIKNDLIINLNSRPSDLKPEIYYKITKLFEQN